MTINTLMTVPGKSSSSPRRPDLDETFVPDPMINNAVGNHLVMREIGRGGMGIVYEAVHGVIGKKRALKVLRPDNDVVKSGRHKATSAEVDRFLQEAVAAARVGGRHAVTIHDTGQLIGSHYGKFDGYHYIVMEYLEGRDLMAVCRSQVLGDDEVVRIGIQCARGLHACHRAGIVHRDLKPSNIFLVSEDNEIVAKLLDFGIAKVTSSNENLLPPAVATTKVETMQNVVMGTPSYMAPEQMVSSKDVDWRADIFSLGCVLYWMLVRELPFKGDDVLAVHNAKARLPTLVTELRPTLYASWNTVIRGCLAARPEDRYQDMRQLAADLSRASPNGGAILAHWWHDLAMEIAPEPFPTARRATAPAMPVSDGVPELQAIDLSSEPDIQIGPITPPASPSSIGRRGAELQAAALPTPAPNAPSLGGTVFASPSVVAAMSQPMQPNAPTPSSYLPAYLTPSSSDPHPSEHSYPPAYVSSPSIPPVVGMIAPRSAPGRSWLRLTVATVCLTLLTAAVIGAVAYYQRSGVARMVPASLVPPRPVEPAPVTPTAPLPAPVAVPATVVVGPAVAPELKPPPSPEESDGQAKPSRRSKRHSGKQRPEVPSTRPAVVDPNGLM